MQLPTLHQVTHFPVHLHHQPNGTFGHGPIIISHHGAIPLRDQSNYNYNDDFYPSSVFMSPPSSVLLASPPPLPPIRDHNNNILSLPPRPTLLLAKDVDKNAIVGATQFRVGQLLQWMAQQKTDPRWMDLASKRRLLEVKVHQVSGIGFLSYIYRIEFFFEDTKSPFSVILKVPSIINLSVFSKEHEFLSNWAYKLSDRHNKEIISYEHFGRRIAAAGIVHVPKIFHASLAETPKDLEKGCILMEDLDQLGIMGNTVLGLSKLQVEGLIRAMARIHALSLAVPGSELLLEQLRFKFSLDEEDGQAKFNAINALVATGHDYWARHGALLTKIAGKHELMLRESHLQFGVPPVLCHGDMWANNVFFERMPDGKAGDELYAIIDWQFSQPNSGLQDFARLVLLCTNSSLKLHHLDEWLELYYDTFADSCRNWGVRCPYTMHLVRQMFMAHYPSEMFFSIVILMNAYARLDDAGLKTALLGRMISSFEYLRQKMMRSTSVQV